MWPKGMPIKWGNVLIKPNFIPEVVSIALLGPGVINIVKQNADKAENKAKFIINIFQLSYQNF